VTCARVASALASGKKGAQVMRTRLPLVVSLAVALLALAVPARAAGAEALHLSFDGLSAEASFTSADPSGCVSTEVFVFADDGHFRTGPGRLEKAATATVVVSQIDFCTDTLLLAAQGLAVLTPGQFQIDGKITAASLTATIEVLDDVSGASFPVNISVSWTGVGDTFSVKQRSQETVPGFKINQRFDATGRHAAAAGTVSDGTTNFTPEPALVAELASVRQGELDIIHQ
jgi:hypothetical protein